METGSRNILQMFSLALYTFALRAAAEGGSKDCCGHLKCYHVGFAVVIGQLDLIASQ